MYEYYAIKGIHVYLFYYRKACPTQISSSLSPKPWVHVYFNKGFIHVVVGTVCQVFVLSLLSLRQYDVTNLNHATSQAEFPPVAKVLISY